MELNIANWIVSSQLLGFAVAVFIVLITMVFIAKKIVGFLMTLLLLLFALISGLAIANKDLIHDYFYDKLSTESSSSKQASDQFKEQMFKDYEKLKKDFNEQKEQMKDLIEKEKNSEPVKKAVDIDNMHSSFSNVSGEKELEKPIEVMPAKNREIAPNATPQMQTVEPLTTPSQSDSQSFSSSQQQTISPSSTPENFATPETTPDSPSLEPNPSSPASTEKKIIPRDHDITRVF